jgi:putative AlgH/UPF0301 family transcriptional regulator
LDADLDPHPGDKVAERRSSRNIRFDSALQTAFLKAALPKNPDEALAQPSLAGQLLVAAPSMGDSHFERTVTLIVQHNPSGAVGIVINKPIGETPIASIFEAVGQKGGDVLGEVRVFSGGPVQPEVGFVVHSADYRRPETVAVSDRLSMTSSLDILRDIGAKKWPAKILVAFGTPVGDRPTRTRDQSARLGDCGGRPGANLRRGQGQSLGPRLEASDSESLNVTESSGCRALLATS